MLTVTVNDRPVDVAAIVERGRVLLPLRATFSALGADVDYDGRGRVIVARTPLHTLRLPLGSTVAFVDGRSVSLDVPAQVAGARTYVPVRFVAQAMGATVGYDARANLVSIYSNAASGLDPANVVVMNPLHSASTPYPTISASLSGAVADRRNVILALDGQDVTPLASFDGSTVTYIPRMPLAAGAHTVVFSGKTLAGQPFSQTWSFQTTESALQERDAPPLQNFDYRFFVNGQTHFHAGDWMHFTLIAPPGGSAALQLCGLGFDYPLSNGGNGNMYQADVPAPYGYWIPSCNVTAVYTTWTGQQVAVPVPLEVGLYTLPSAPGTKHPSPSPSPSHRELPKEPRRSEPSASPGPARTPAPQAVRTAHPMVHPPAPRPRETPTTPQRL